MVRLLVPFLLVISCGISREITAQDSLLLDGFLLEIMVIEDQRLTLRYEYRPSNKYWQQLWKGHLSRTYKKINENNVLAIGLSSMYHLDRQTEKKFYRQLAKADIPIVISNCGSFEKVKALERIYSPFSFEVENEAAAVFGEGIICRQALSDGTYCKIYKVKGKAYIGTLQQPKKYTLSQTHFFPEVKGIHQYNYYLGNDNQGMYIFESVLLFEE